MCSLILWQRLKRTPCRFVKLLLWRVPSSLVLCFANPSHFSLLKPHSLSPQVSKTTMLCLGSPALLCSLKFSQAESHGNCQCHFAYFLSLKNQNPMLLAVKYLKTVTLYLLSTFLDAYGKTVSPVPVILSWLEAEVPRSPFGSSQS